jgi:hypothetical protein
VLICLAVIIKLAKRLSVQQPVLSTALVFVRRFYLKVPLRKSNPYLLVATAFYLACKVEEAPQHIKMVVTEAKTLWSGMSCVFAPGLLTILTSTSRLHHTSSRNSWRVRVLAAFRDWCPARGASPLYTTKRAP